ncbi:MAG: FHA domain-containing protein, partial [Polyangiales bacterium]
MRHGVNATQCRAAGLPEVSFSVDLDEMTAAPRPGAYLSGGGPPGGPLWFVILPAWGQGAAALEPTLLSLLPTQDRSVALCNAPLAGSLRPCLVAVAGQEYGRVAAMAALVVDPRACPQGMIVVAARDGRGVAQPTLDALFHSGPLRTLCESLSFGEPQEVAPEAEGVLTLRGPQGVTQHPLRGPRVLLGRSQHADVVLFDARVSRQHAVLEHRGEGWVLVIVPNAQGVTVRGALRAQGEYLLAHGESFELGETVAHLA